MCTLSIIFFLLCSLVFQKIEIIAPNLNLLEETEVANDRLKFASNLFLVATQSPSYIKQTLEIPKIERFIIPYSSSKELFEAPHGLLNEKGDIFYSCRVSWKKSARLMVNSDSDRIHSCTENPYA